MFYLLRPIKRWMDQFTATPAEINEIADLSAQGVLVKAMKVPISSTPTGGEDDLGVDLPAKGVVLGVYLDVTTEEATGTTKTLDVGLLSTESGGDADGFLVGIDCSSSGLKKGTLDSGGQTLGALLAVDESGGGVLVPEAHVIGEAVSLTVTAGSADWEEFVGDLYILYAEISA